ncbi:MAG TPA: ABC transporter substrate-binding protein [Solirubrobacteraceae bacterium]|nr:ABC transporter substrate-binding protein [Solirubrobacteraceae bacterium]
MTRARLALLLALPVLLLAGCGEKPEPSGDGTPGRAEELRLVLDYFPNADHAGIYAAAESGEYGRAGLDVEIQAPPDPSAPLKLLQAGRADLAISYEPELLLARDKDLGLVAVGALVQKPLTSLMSLPRAGIRSARDLRGKRVGTAGIPYQSAYLETILAEAGVDPASVRETNVGFNLVPALRSKRVDATLGAFWNYEGIQLARQGDRPRIQRMEDLGVPTYAELVFVARREDLDEDGASRIRRFLQATARGHELLRTEPETGLDGLLAADPGLDRGLQAAVIDATLPVFFPADESKPFGWQNPDEWDAYAAWMRENDLITQPLPGARAMTNEFLPGEGLDPGRQS